jgi:hypothetical protein
MVEVVVRLIDGDAVPVGSFANVDAAKSCARDLIRLLAGPEREWPLLGERSFDPTRSSRSISSRRRRFRSLRPRRTARWVVSGCRIALSTPI